MKEFPKGLNELLASIKERVSKREVVKISVYKQAFSDNVVNMILNYFSPRLYLSIHEVQLLEISYKRCLKLNLVGTRGSFCIVVSENKFLAWLTSLLRD